MPKIFTGPGFLGWPGRPLWALTNKTYCCPAPLVKFTVRTLLVTAPTCWALLVIMSLAPETKLGVLKFSITLEATKYMPSSAFIVAVFAVAGYPEMLGSNINCCALGSGLFVLIIVTLCNGLLNTGSISSRPLKLFNGPVTCTSAPAGGRLV